MRYAQHIYFIFSKSRISFISLSHTGTLHEQSYAIESFKKDEARQHSGLLQNTEQLNHSLTCSQNFAVQNCMRLSADYEEQQWQYNYLYEGGPTVLLFTFDPPLIYMTLLTVSLLASSRIRLNSFNRETAYHRTTSRRFTFCLPLEKHL